ncbi:ribonuclease HII [Lapidilactobacillus mulanensis]|uniref:Ribonuclease HII n=1 Tax=Lapidilactobacillus mulanensis TaxID=2485999 RepID=A0ABW4DR27_9LACO|nr:ribonuclease HII [Lapidilactobacillus mulanensis]
MSESESIAQIKAELLMTPDLERLTVLAADPRKGVQLALKQFQRRQAQVQARQQALAERLRLEKQLWPQYPLIAGIDEVGRGPLAGPVITAAVILPHDFQLLDVNDSKQLSASKREELYLEILGVAVDLSIGICDAPTIDRENIYHATELAMAQAVNDLHFHPNFLLVDAMHVPVDLPQQKLIKGDQKSASIAAASIVAKQVRDHLMGMYDHVYPGYDFAHNAGYGTQKHLAGLAELGPTPIHRHSFSPVHQYL